MALFCQVLRNADNDYKSRNNALISRIFILNCICKAGSVVIIEKQ